MKFLKNISLQRESNGELVRLICMQFILLHHFIIYGLPVDIRSLIAPVNAESIVAVFATGFVYVAVNCFILLSGYYGIKFKWSGLLHLYLFILFYNLLWMSTHLFIGDKEFTIDYMLKSILVFTHDGAPWFLRAYMILYCVSPILNAFINNSTKKNYVFVIILLTILNLLLGYGYAVDGFNPNGYNYQQFIYIYMIGAYLKRYFTQERIDACRRKSFGIWGLMAILWGGMTILNAYTPISIWKPWTYNNPVVIIGAVGFFCYMMSFHFESRFINYLALSTLSIYLMQTKCFSAYCALLMTPFTNEQIAQFGLLSILCKFAIMIVGVLAFSALCIVIDQIRIIMMTPLINKVKKIETNIL